MNNQGTTREPKTKNDPENPYRAFVSYARKDNKEKGRKWADFLHGEIKNCLMPDEFAQPPHNVFLDLENLETGGDLTPKLEEAIKNSETLLVICSPQSAESTYVNSEIEYFVDSHLEDFKDRIFLALIEGSGNPDDREDSGLPSSIRRLFPEELPIWADFRPDQDGQRTRGWTSSRDYKAHLRKEDDFSKTKQKKLSDLYHREQRSELFRLLAALFPPSPPYVLEILNLSQQNQIQKKSIIQWTTMALVAVICASIAFLFFLNAERERERAEKETLRALRSQLMIGDAHQRATTMAANLILEVRKNELSIDSDSEKGSISERLSSLREETQTTVFAYLDEIGADASTETSSHMKSVALNSKGHLALRLGNLEEADQFFDESRQIRENLAKKSPEKPLYIHNLAISYDNLGATHTLLAEQLEFAGDFKKSDKKLQSALDYYRNGLAQSERLVTKNPDQIHWHHNVAVSYFKIGLNRMRIQEFEPAFQAFLKATEEASLLTAHDPEYTKWHYLEARSWLFLGDVLTQQAVDDQAAREALLNSLEILAKIHKGSPETSEAKQIESRAQALLSQLP